MSKLRYSDKTMYGAVKVACRNHPTNVAYRFMSKPTLYPEFVKKIDILASSFFALGVRKGDRVLILSPNIPQSVDAVYALNKIGAIVAMIHPLSAENELSFYMQDTDAKAVVCLSQNVPMLFSAQEKVGKKPMLIVADKPTFEEQGAIGWGTFMAMSTGESPEETDKDAPAVIFYSGGTTGKPKGVLLSSYNLNVLALQTEYACGCVPMCNYSALAVIPIFHGFGFGVSVHMMLSSGGMSILVPKFSAKDFASLLLQEKPNIIAGVPTLYNALLMAQDMDGQDFSFVKGIFAGGDALPEKLKISVDSFLKEHNCDVVLREGYGLTETVTACCLTPSVGAKKGSIGLPFDDTEFRICKPGTEEVLPIGERGEICISGPSVMLGYLNNPEETALVLHRENGKTWLHTGDLAYMDEDGFVFFVQRIKRMIVSSGYNVFPSELEKILNVHPKVAESCCIGIDDPYRLKKVKAFIVLKNKAEATPETEEELLAYCNANMAKYAVPSVIEFISELPHTKVGKVAFAELERREKEREKQKSFSVGKEEALQIAIRETLGVDFLRSAEDFFRAGGNSVKIFILLTKLKKYGYELSLRDFSSAKSQDDILKAMKVSEEDTSVAVPLKKPSEKTLEAIHSLYGEKVDKIYPLTPMQEAIYFQQGEHNSDLYNTLITVKCDERMDDALFGKATELLSERYEIIKTAFYEDNDFWQCIVPERTVEHSVRRGNPEEIAKKEWARSFDLQKDTLLRMILVHAEDGDYILQNGHHIVIDGVSQTLIFVTFADIYKQLKNKPTDEIIPILHAQAKKDLPFERYVQYLCGKDEKKGLEYFRTVLDGYENGVLKISGSASRKKSGEYSAKYCVLPPKDALDISDFAKKEGITVGMLFKAVWGIILQKYTYAEDVVFGEVHRGRSEDLSGISDAVGMFINTVPVRLHVDASKSLHEFFSEIREQNIRSNPYLTVPLSEVNAQITHGAVVGTLLNFQDNDRTSYQTGSDGFRRVRIQSYNNFELEFEVTIGEERCAYNICYDTSVYTEEDIERLAERIGQTFRFIVKNPQATLGQIDILSEREKRELYHFNDTKCPYDGKETFVSRFEKQVEDCPNDIALTFYDRTKTYRELDEESNYVCRLLLEKGIQKGDTVGILTQRGFGMISAIVGTLKAGGVYLPLDESYPTERLQFILQDSQTKTVLCGENVSFSLDFSTVRGWEGKTGEKCTLPISQEDNAYIIYTSGTTGKPKGVVIDHRALTNMLRAYEKIYGLQKSDVVLQVASYTFDQSVWDIFGTLAFGAELALISDDDVHDPEMIARYCNRKGVTVAAFTPAMVAELDPNRFDTLRLLDTSGETASVSVLKRWLHKVKVVNSYGPTECTNDVCSYVYQGAEEDNIPIGAPIDNTRFFVLGKGDSLCGVGMNGELCIAGDGVSRTGYLNRPDLTAEKFVPSADGNGMMYRSGDLTRWRKDGVIEFLNRIDGQIKIRGFRIELGEIDSVLRAIEGVKDCYVGVFTFAETKALAAYLVTEWETDDIRGILRKELPEYMVPQYFVKIDRIPRSLAGKVDRKALPLPSRMETSHTQLTTPAEIILQKAVSELIACEKIYAEDDFFDLGGDSIKAIRLVTKLRSYGYKITVKEIMSLRVLRDIAQNIQQEEEKTFWAYPENPTTKEDFGCADISDVDFEYIQEKYGQNIERIYPLTPLQKGMIFYALGEEYPDYVTQRIIKGGEYSEKIMREAVELVTLRFEVLRTAFVCGQNGEWQIILKKRSPEILFVDGDLQELAQKDFMRGFDLQNDCLFRLTVVPKRGVIQTAHHAIVDGWSEEILWNVFQKYYDLLQKGKDFGKMRQEVIRENKSSPRFENYVALLTKKDKEKAKEYFRTLSEGKTITYFPAKGGKYMFNTKRASEIIKTFDRSYSDRLHNFSRQSGVTFSAFCQTVWGIVLARANGRDDVVFGNVISGRNGEIPGMDAMVGMFINTVPVCVTLKGTVKELLQTVAHQARESEENGYISLADIGTEIGTICVFTQTGKGLENVCDEIDQTNYPLEWEITDGEEVNFVLRYNAEVYAENEMKKLEKDIESVFRQITDGEEDLNRILYKADGVSTEKPEEKVIRIKEKPQGKESVVVRAVQELLQVSSVYRDDDFFALGGDSIQAIRLSVRLRAAGYECTVKDITQNRTMRKIAATLRENAEEKSEDRRKKYLRKPTNKEEYGAYGMSDADFERILKKYKDPERIYPVAPLQEGMIYHSLEDNAYITQSIIKIEKPDIEKMRQALEALSIRYEVLRTAFVTTESGSWQVLVKNRQIEVTFVTDRSVKEVAKEQYDKGFNLEQDSLFRVAVVENKECYLIQTAHHIILDGWSEDIVWRTFEEYYKTLKEGVSVETIMEKAKNDNLCHPRFEEYISLCKNKDKNRAKNYYKQMLSSFDGAIALPALSENKEVAQKKTEEEKYSFSEEISKGIRVFSQKNGVTVPTFLETLWGVLLGKLTGTGDAVFGNVVSGRSGDMAGMDEMVGLFINTVPVRVMTGKTFAETMKRTAEQITETEGYSYVPLFETGAKIGTVCVFENFETENTFVPEEEHDQTNYNLEWEISGKEKITFVLRYNSGVYDREEMERISVLLQKSIVLLCKDGDADIDRLFDLGKDEEERYKEAFIKEKVQISVRKCEPVQGEKESVVARCFKELLFLEDVFREDDFFAVGGDSIKAIRLSAKLNGLGYYITVKEITECKTVRDIAEQMKKEQEVITDEETRYWNNIQQESENAGDIFE